MTLEISAELRNILAVCEISLSLQTGNSVSLSSFVVYHCWI